LISGFVDHDPPTIDYSIKTFSLIWACTFAKGALFLYCRHINTVAQSDTVGALAEDHLNDVMSNFMAIVTAMIAGTMPKYWWMDAMGAIAISGNISRKVSWL
jgi:divalent metal cation (Fe/Co/Zn/Cd) transporter